MYAVGVVSIDPTQIPSPWGDFCELKPPKQSYKPPKLKYETPHIIGVFVKFSGCQAPLLKTFGDGSDSTPSFEAFSEKRFVVITNLNDIIQLYTTYTYHICGHFNMNLVNYPSEKNVSDCVDILLRF